MIIVSTCRSFASAASSTSRARSIFAGSSGYCATSARAASTGVCPRAPVAARRGDAARCGASPAVTYAFAAAAHHPSWLAKRAVAIDHLSGGRLDLRFAVGAEARDVAASWARHGIAYPTARERLARLEATIDAIRRLWAGASVTSRALGLRDARIEPPPGQRPGPPAWGAAMGPR